MKKTMLSERQISMREIYLYVHACFPLENIERGREMFFNIIVCMYNNHYKMKILNH